MSEMEVRPAGEIEIRSATLTGVSFPQRTIELVVMPYEQETVVEHQGRMVREIISQGAFKGIQRRKIKANRDHDITKVVGHCTSLQPNRADGLVAEVKIADTLLGDETLTLANDGILDASAGFMPMAGGEQWEGRNRRRITRAWLGHVAFVPEPAYEGARVLAVRSADPNTPAGIVVATPNLDLVRAWQLQKRYAELDR